MGLTVVRVEEISYSPLSSDQIRKLMGALAETVSGKIEALAYYFYLTAWRGVRDDQFFNLLNGSQIQLDYPNDPYRSKATRKAWESLPEPIKNNLADWANKEAFSIILANGSKWVISLCGVDRLIYQDALNRAKGTTCVTVNP